MYYKNQPLTKDIVHAVLNYNVDRKHYASKLFHLIIIKASKSFTKGISAKLFCHSSWQEVNLHFAKVWIRNLQMDSKSEFKLIIFDQILNIFMFDSSKNYSKEEIYRLIRALKEEQDAVSWLSENDLPELVAFYHFLINQNEEAMDSLISHGFLNLSAFLSAINNDEQAFNYLSRSGNKVWAAMASLIHGDEDAYTWLKNNDYNHYLLLAKTIVPILGTFTISGGGMMIGGGGSFGGGGGFGGFGGGSFGGGGAGGSW